MSKLANQLKDFAELLERSNRPAIKYQSGNLVLEYNFKGEVSEANDDELTITHYISTNDIDRYQTVLVPSGMKFQNYEKAGKPVFFNHNWDKLPVGRSLWIKATDKGIIAKTQFLVNFYSSDYNEFVKNLYKAYKEGVLKTWSVAFLPIKHHNEEINGVQVTVFDEWELIEYSAVTIPANPHAVSLNSLQFSNKVEERRVVRHTIEYKLDNESSWDKNKAIASLRKWASEDGSGDKDKIDWAKYSQGFAWYDEENKENFRSYKLPHHWVKDGEFYVVRRGVIAAMAALFGARGGVDIPDDERKRVYNHLAEHYNEFGDEPPEFRDYSEEELIEIFPEEFKLEHEVRNLKKMIENIQKRIDNELIVRIDNLENYVSEEFAKQHQEVRVLKASDLVRLLTK